MKHRVSRIFMSELRSRAGSVVPAETRVKFVTLGNQEYLFCCGREGAAEPAERFSVLPESSGDAIFMVDQGRIVDSNHKARKMSGDLEAMLTEYPPFRKLMARALSGEEVTFRRYGQRSNGSRFHLEWTLCRIQVEGHVRLLVIAVDVRARRQAAHRLAQLSGRLLQMQDEERRRIARELHDSTGQHLVALSMNLSMILSNSSGLDPRTRERLEQCLALAGSSARETRTMSYLLHPPLLDELGLDAALRGYIDGYSERTGIRVDLDLPSHIGRLSREIEIALFRIVQEGLANIHRHSGSPTATLRLTHHANRVELKLADFGRGLASASRIGVGIAGMRERARQLGGRLSIASSQAGTTLHVVLPYRFSPVP
jgi:PAS domain S-box-containing protein